MDQATQTLGTGNCCAAALRASLRTGCGLGRASNNNTCSRALTTCSRQAHCDIELHTEAHRSVYLVARAICDDVSRFSGSRRLQSPIQPPNLAVHEMVAYFDYILTDTLTLNAHSIVKALLDG
jgi:hypothetical protein